MRYATVCGAAFFNVILKYLLYRKHAVYKTLTMREVVAELCDNHLIAQNDNVIIVICHLLSK